MRPLQIRMASGSISEPRGNDVTRRSLLGLAKCLDRGVQDFVGEERALQLTANPEDELAEPGLPVEPHPGVGGPPRVVDASC